MRHLLILVPFFSFLVLNMPFGRLMKRICFFWALVLSLAQMVLVFMPNAPFWHSTLGLFGSVFRFDLLVDNLTLVMLFCIAITIFVTLLASRRSITDLDNRLNFVNLILIIMAGLNGVVLVKDIFSLYVFLEIAAAASFILIVFDKDILAFEGAFKYLIISALASMLMLISIAFMLMVSGSADFYVIRSSLAASSSSPLIILAMVIFVAAGFIKAGLMPFHGWVPDAYSSAPAPVSILLAGIVTKTVGVYTLIRVVNSVFNFHPSLNNALLFIGAITVILGAISALGQKDFKRMLAYSSISQVGYIILGLGSASALGLMGAVSHLFNHCIFKSLLFINSAAVESQTGSRDMDNMSGLAQKMPLTGLTSVLGSLSCAGIPPLAGFWSKLLIIMALMLTGHYFYALIAVLASVLTLGYFLSMQNRVFFGQLRAEFNNIKEAGAGVSFAALFLSAITLGVGVFFPFLLTRFIMPLAGIFGK